MKKYFLFFQALFFTIPVLKPQISISCETSPVWKAGQFNMVTVTIFFDTIDGLTRFTQDFPEGFEIVPENVPAADFSWYNSQLNFVWLNIPENKQTTLSYLVRPGISINGTFDLNGRLIYVSGGKTRRTFEMNNVPVTVLSEQPALPGENTSSERNLQDKPVDGVVFRIQVATSSKPVPADQVAKKLGLTHGEKLIMVKTGNVYKYQTGSFTSYEQVSAMQKKLAASGLKDAFVVAYRGDKQIPVSEAVKR